MSIENLIVSFCIGLTAGTLGSIMGFGWLTWQWWSILLLAAISRTIGNIEADD